MVQGTEHLTVNHEDCLLVPMKQTPQFHLVSALIKTDFMPPYYFR